SRLGLDLVGKNPLDVSNDLPTVTPEEAKPVQGSVSATASVMIPYDQWYVPPDQFTDERKKRQYAVTIAKPAQVPGTLERLVQLYLGDGLGAEAKGYLDILREEYPDYYTAHKLSLLHAASNVMTGHFEDAAEDAAAPELEGLEEARLWRE